MAGKKKAPTPATRVGNGAGWGGPAKGASSKPKPMLPVGPGPGRGRYSIKGEERSARIARHAEEMRALLYRFANSSLVKPETRIAAATHLMNRNEGMPIAKVVTAVEDEFSNKTEAQLLAERERIAAKLAEIGDAPDVS